MTPEAMGLSPEEIATELRMMATLKNGPFILVEGSADVTFFSVQMAVDIENIIPTYGWENLFDIMTNIHSAGLNNVLGVIDLDYRAIVPKDGVPRDVITTDYHDIETTMFFSGAFNRVLIQRGSREKAKRYGSTFTSSADVIRLQIVELAKPIGALRLYSQINSNSYSFDRMDVKRFVSRKTMSFSVRQFVAHLRGIHSNNRHMSDSIIEKALAEAGQIEAAKDPRMLCCGHDLMEIMALGMISVWGTHDSRGVTDSDIESLFISAYSQSMFRGTGLFRRMDNWLKINGYADAWSAP